VEEMVCWCCEHFVSFGEIKIINKKFIDGRCGFNGTLHFSENSVCEEFVLRSGFHTTRKIPDICKNYKDIVFNGDD